MGVQKVINLVSDENTSPSSMMQQVTAKDATSYVAVGAKVRSCLRGEALELCCGRDATTLVQILDVLSDAYGKMQVVDNEDDASTT